MSTEAASHADFSQIRYAQVWEDADVLIAALAPQPTHTVLSIASAGDNALALVASGARVVALDLNPAQLACLELRVAAYRTLDHSALLELIGSRPSTRRAELFVQCRPQLTPDVRQFWDAKPDAIAAGIGTAGKFERYFATFRQRVLPLVHNRKCVAELLRGGDAAGRETFYERRWNTWRWWLLFRVFFSRFIMGRLGRDPAFFRYVQGSVSDRILARTRYALTALNPAENPYLTWILTGTHGDALPFALREENFAAIRANLHRLEWRLQTVEAFLAAEPDLRIDGANLSDIFEYMSEENTAALLARLAAAANPGARFAYWNMLAPRWRPESLAHQLRPLDALAAELFAKDRAFFYSRFVVEEVK